MDRKVIDGFLHKVAELTFALGTIFREKFDVAVINGFLGDKLGWKYPQWIAEKMRQIQSGNIQQYMIVAMLGVFIALFAYLMVLQ